MTPEDIKNYIKDTVYQSTQSTKQENSGLIGDLKRLIQEEIATKMMQTNIIASDIKDSHMAINRALGEIKNTVDGTNKRLDQLNGSVAKHTDKFASQDILNAQTTMTQIQQTSDLQTLKSNDKVFDEFRISFLSSLNTFKWLFGILGIGNLIIFAKIILGVF